MVMAMLKRRMSRLMQTASNTWVIQEVCRGPGLRPREIFRALILPVCHEIAKSRHKRKFGPTCRPCFTEPARFIKKCQLFRTSKFRCLNFRELTQSFPKRSLLEFVLGYFFHARNFCQHRRLGDFSRGFVTKTASKI